MAAHRREERGSVTAELAVAFPAVILALALTLAAGQVGIAQVRCADAARAAVREAVRGEDAGTVVQQARRLGPAGAVVAVSRGGRIVGVDVTTTVRLPLPGSPAVTVRGRATGLAEQS